MSAEIKTGIRYDDTLSVERPDYENEIIKIIQGSYSPKAAQNMLEDYHGNDIAQVMEQLSRQGRKKGREGQPLRLRRDPPQEKPVLRERSRNESL